MQITIDLPDNLPLTEANVRIELAMVLDRQHSDRDWNIEVRSGVIVKFYGWVCDLPQTSTLSLNRANLGSDWISAEVEIPQFSQRCQGFDVANLIVCQFDTFQVS